MDNLTFLAYITHQYLYAQFEKKQKLQSQIARMFHELLSRDREDGCATRQPQGVGSRGVLEQYVAGLEVRARPGGRSYPLSQKAIHEIYGLKEGIQMNEDIAAFEKALEAFLKVFRGDVMEIVDKGALPISFIIAFREPSLDGFETIQYIARSTQGCPPGLQEALKEVIYNWARKTYTEFTAVDEMPVFRQ